MNIGQVAVQGSQLTENQTRNSIIRDCSSSSVLSCSAASLPCLFSGPSSLGNHQRIKSKRRCLVLSKQTQRPNIHDRIDPQVANRQHVMYPRWTKKQTKNCTSTRGIPHTALLNPGVVQVVHSPVGDKSSPYCCVPSIPAFVFPPEQTMIECNCMRVIDVGKGPGPSLPSGIPS
jgi:hypothetical protein